MDDYTYDQLEFTEELLTKVLIYQLPAYCSSAFELSGKHSGDVVDKTVDALYHNHFRTYYLLDDGKIDLDRTRYAKFVFDTILRQINNVTGKVFSQCLTCSTKGGKLKSVIIEPTTTSAIFNPLIDIVNKVVDEVYPHLEQTLKEYSKKKES